MFKKTTIYTIDHVRSFDTTQYNRQCHTHRQSRGEEDWSGRLTIDASEYLNPIENRPKISDIFLEKMGPKCKIWPKKLMQCWPRPRESWSQPQPWPRPLLAPLTPCRLMTRNTYKYDIMISTPVASAYEMVNSA